MAEAVGRLLIVGFEGADFAEIEALLTRVRPAGLIFFKRNYPGGEAREAPGRLRAIIGRAQGLADSLLGRRLLIAIDHEGGRVRRLPAPYSALPAPGTLSAARAGALAEAGARELAATGFNFNLAPVLDVAPPRGGAYLGDRAFSDDPDQVADCGRASLAAFHRVGILGAGKHFPGLGSAVLDPHQELPTIEADRARLEEVDWRPYRGLAGGELGAVMSTHALYPALDPERPATFSEEIVRLLKEGLSFSGALLTDDLEMGAAVKYYPPGQAAVAALRAGHDLALICRRADYVEAGRQALGLAVGRGLISEKRLTGALDRSAGLLRRLEAIWPAEGLRARWFEELVGRPEDKPA
ncbi:MAG: beta-N-acetylhexosaminidase [Candidatus Adiutrix sp.]|nr:beta-N-acetylhexosaminidase [Candidatus Adiutrix sp.]